MYRAVLGVLILLLILLQYRLWLGEGGYASVYRINREIEAQAHTNQARNTRNRQLEAEIESLKEGESFFLITEP